MYVCTHVASSLYTYDFILFMVTKHHHESPSHNLITTRIDVLPSKNQALCEYCTLVSKQKHC